MHNYETWIVNLWLGNEQSSCEYWDEQAAEHLKSAPTSDQVERGVWTVENAARHNLADQLKEEHQDRAAAVFAESSVFTDLLGGALYEVCWDDIAEHFIEAALEAVAND